MKAAIATAYGSPEVIRIAEVPTPAPKKNQVLIRIHASAVNAADWRLRRANPWFVRLVFGPFKPRRPILGVVFASLAFYAETDAQPDKFPDIPHAMWWAFVTITTVGYGDRFPTSNWGRLIGVFVMIAGVGLFGTLSGFLANQFLTPPTPREPEAPAEAPAPTDPKARIAELKQMLDAQEQANADLRAKLEEIDQLL